MALSCQRGSGHGEIKGRQLGRRGGQLCGRLVRRGHVGRQRLIGIETSHEPPARPPWSRPSAIRVTTAPVRFIAYGISSGQGTGSPYYSLLTGSKPHIHDPGTGHERDADLRYHLLLVPSLSASLPPHLPSPFPFFCQTRFFLASSVSPYFPPFQVSDVNAIFGFSPLYYTPRYRELTPLPDHPLLCVGEARNWERSRAF